MRFTFNSKCFWYLWAIMDHFFLDILFDKLAVQVLTGIKFAYIMYSNTIGVLFIHIIFV